MDGGWIKLHRKIMKNPIYQDPHVFRLFIHCLFEANWEDSKYKSSRMSETIIIKRGQFVTGRLKLHFDLYGRKKKPCAETVWKWLQSLKKDEILTINSSNKNSIVTIVNYDTYQDALNQNLQQSSPLTPSRVTAELQQSSTLEEDKELKEVKKKTPCVERLRFTHDDMELAGGMLKTMTERYPPATPANLKRWANTIRLMREIDKLSCVDIKRVWDWSQNDSFWFENIRSPKKLREQWDRLSIKASDNGQVLGDKARKTEQASQQYLDQVIKNSEGEDA